MAYQWFILKQGKELGPVTSIELRRFAERRGISPSTQVRRVTSAGSTPWTKAGEIKSLFLGIVDERVAPPLCNECGEKLPNLTCATCNKFSPSLPDSRDFLEELPPIESGPQTVRVDSDRASVVPASEMPYEAPSLRSNISVLQTSAKTLMVLAMLLVGIFSILFANDVIESGRTDVILGALAFVLLTTLVAYLVYLITMTFAETLRRLPDKEEIARLTGFDSRSHSANNGREGESSVR